MSEQTGWEATPAPTRIVGGLATIVFGCWMTWTTIQGLVSKSTVTGQALVAVGVLLVLLGVYWLISGILRAVRNRRRT